MRIRGAPSPALPPAPAVSLVDDARGVARLAIESAVGVTDIVEHLHASISAGLLPWASTTDARAPGIAGQVYRGVRGAMRGVGWGIDTAFSQFEGALRLDLVEREHLRAVVNGLHGDRLAAAGNPLAIPMRLTVASPVPSRRIAVFVHGLCMHDRQWPRDAASLDAAVRALGYTPVYLHYNSGQQVESNGAELSRRLAALIATWPMPVTDVSIIAHSMGGIVARHATAQAVRDEAGWLAKLRSLVFLGTPHRGSALERNGTLLDLALGKSRFSAPFARIGTTRSAGIRDLGKDHSALPMPPGIIHVAVAGSLTRGTDGLVGVRSALGLPLPDRDRIVIAGAGHLELLNHPEAVAAVKRVLVMRRRSTNAIK